MDDTLNLDNLPANSQEAFTQYARQVRSQYENQSRGDHERNTGMDGFYEGSYDPERTYVGEILAFLDEYGLETQIPDISNLDDAEFYEEFKRFKSKVEYTARRYDLRKNRIATGNIGTVIAIDQSYKPEIGSLLEKIRKVVNQEVPAGNKKEKIFAKIAALQSEVDRDQTTIDAAFGCVLDLSRTLGEAGGNIKPAVDQLERVKNLFWTKSVKVEQLPMPDRPMMISEKKNGEYDTDVGYGQSSNSIDDDEIPF